MSLEARFHEKCFKKIAVSTNSGFKLTKGIHDLQWFSDSPDAGEPECICSLCGKVIAEGEPPIRLFRGGVAQ